MGLDGRYRGGRRDSRDRFGDGDDDNDDDTVCNMTPFLIQSTPTVLLRFKLYTYNILNKVTPWRRRFLGVFRM